MEVKGLKRAIKKFIDIERRKMSLSEVEEQINDITKSEIKNADRRMMKEYDEEMAKRGNDWQFLSKEEYLKRVGER